MKPDYTPRAGCINLTARRILERQKRRGRESNPRIAVLQTAALPLGYPAESKSHERNVWSRSVNARGS